jgi:hypothetical protein
LRLPEGFARAAAPRTLAETLIEGEGRAVFSSSRGRQRSWIRPDGVMSVYTYHLVEALQGAGNGPGETAVRVSNLMNYLGRAVPHSARRLCDAEQTPFFETAAEDFPIALLRGGKGLPAGGWGAVRGEARETMERVYRVVQAGPVASARGAGAQAASGRSVVADTVQGPVVTGDGNITAGGDVIMAPGGEVQVGGIRAGRIEARNVVDGVQVQGGDPAAAAGLVELARAIRRGGITAGQIQAQNLVSGLQYIADPGQATVSDLQREVAALRQQVAGAIAAGEVADEDDAEDAQDALAAAETALAAPEPRGNRAVRKLAEVADILTRSAEVAEALGRVGAQVIKLAPVAATLWQIAQSLFGG